LNTVNPLTEAKSPIQTRSVIEAGVNENTEYDSILDFNGEYFQTEW